MLFKHNLKTGVRVFSGFHGLSKTHTITNELGNTYEEMKGKMLESLAKYQKEGSGWQLYSIKGLDISIVKFNPLDGSGYSKLPKLISDKKKAVINMKNEKCKKECGKCEKCVESEMCFKWAVARALNPVKDHAYRVTELLKDQAEKYDWSEITFPVKVKDIRIWENNNNKFVNVFGYDEDKNIYSVKLCDNHTSIVLSKEESQDDKFINLFLHDDNHYSCD